MNIVVLAGGTSTERAISIVSGTEICKALRSKGERAVLVDIFCGIPSVDQENAFPEKYDVADAAAYMKSFDDKIESMKKERRSFFGPNVLEICRMADIVFLGLHGSNGEDGRVQAAFDLMGIRYTGTGYLSSAMAMDKGITKQMFLMNGVPVPKGCSMLLEKRENDLRKLGLWFPVVVKTCCGGSSVGVYMVHDQEEYEKALDAAFSYEGEVVVEQYIDGREFSVAVVDGKAYPVIEIQPLSGFYDYTNKYKPGSTIETCPANIPAELTKKMQEIAEAGARALHMEAYCRLDFIMRDNGDVFCLEANTLPGMTPTSLIPQEAAVLGMTFPDLCEELIRVSMKKYGNCSEQPEALAAEGVRT
ncbi:MAG: D-alanine--D-alanine ligase [Blautia sp.]|nr:D-alanine--D-alanine ligase [Blautia sp.]